MQSLNENCPILLDKMAPSKFRTRAICIILTLRNITLTAELEILIHAFLILASLALTIATHSSLHPLCLLIAA